MDLKQTYFEWFGLPERFDIDLTELESAYRKVQSAVHPDRFTQALDGERRMAMQWATQANEAFRVLRDPTRRARYLCERHGIDLGIETNTAMAPDFLMQQMEWREQLDDARAADALEPVLALAGQLDDKRRDLRQRIGTAIDQQGDYTAAASWVRQLMFVDRFAVDVKAAIERLEN